MKLISGIIVLCFGLFFIALAIATIVRPRSTMNFLNTFASSAKTHFLEQAVRLTGGVALVLFSPHMFFSTAFLVFGWIIVITTVILLVTPWRFHQKFASWAVPFAIRYLPLYVGGSLILGGLLLFAISRDYV